MMYPGPLKLNRTPVIFGLVVLLGLFLQGLESLQAAKNSPLPVLNLSDPAKKYTLDAYIEVLQIPLEDSALVTADTLLEKDTQSRFEPYAESNADFGINDLTTWVRFRVKNSEPHTQTWLLEQAYPMDDHIRLYQTEKNKLTELFSTGDSLPFAHRPVEYHTFVFPLQLPAGQAKTFYLEIGGKSSKQIDLAIFSPQKFAEKTSLEKFGFGIYYGIMIVMACYNLLLFFSVRDRSYLYYVFYITTYTFSQMAFNGMAYQYLWPEWPALHNISMPFSIGLTLLTMILFTRKFLQLASYNPNLRRIADTIIVVSAILSVFSIFGDYLVSLRAALFLILIVVAFILYSGIRRSLEGYRPANYFVIAWTAFMIGGLLIATNKLGILPSFFLADYGVQIGSAIEVTLLSLALADRINVIDQEKKKAQLEVIKAQEKYKHIVEGSDEVIFSLDQDFRILAVNKAIKAHLFIKPEKVIGLPFLDLIHRGAGAEHITHEFVQEKLREFSTERQHMVFKTFFHSPVLSEPKELKVKLQSIEITGGRTETLATVSGVEEDNLLKYFEYERKKMTISNSILAIDDITSRVTRNLGKYIGHNDVGMIKMALREILINAIEHGNLEITFDEKTRALAEDDYFKLLAARQRDPSLAKRKVRIDYIIRSDMAGYRILDDGVGFDHNGQADVNIEERNAGLLDHGRGIHMAKDIFDIVRYNDVGNEVTLIYKYKLEPALSVN